MVRESGISATKPVFPSYLLPSFKFAFPGRRRHSASSTSSTASSTQSESSSVVSSAVTTPAGSPPDGRDSAAFDAPKKSKASSPGRRRLSRTAADTLRCSSCSTDIAFTSQIVSKGFTGRYGRAYLISPATPTKSSSSWSSAPPSLLNIRIGKDENRQLVTGWHVVADICCGICSRKLGWKYVDAKEESQKYKVGKFILETERVVTYRSWEDVPLSEEGREVACGMEADRGGEDDDEGEEEEGGEREEEVEFDSSDEEECEAVFAGVWDAETAARRRIRLGK
ncbi:yippee-domain-containing protein [Trichoderma citrinoviride]|uniref:Yippee-domain-containing protein n=1 Tax=Trichoderma citrinoviride TaxID=58853 RepID=A0A2T4B4I0_9HYPO|nr:yippee-domain-containing protein [Trichoderma citrinoviride]PTB64232.1 yippee-domain-containing protein [Trichoderma citrinoviride]